MSSPLTPNNTTVAFLGIGLMGLPMATNLLKAGYKLRAWNRTRAKAQALSVADTQGDALFIADSVEEAVTGADVVITMLENGSIVDSVLYENKSFLASPENCLIIDMSSIPPQVAKKHHDALSDTGRYYLDAPVSGGTVGASQATLSIMAGGTEDVFKRACPIFDVLGNPTHIGPVSTGQLTKLANQAIVGITIGAVSEALLLACAGGANPVAVRKALNGGFAGSKILELHGQRMIDRNFVPGATSRVQLKDLTMIMNAANDHNLTLPLSQRVFEEYQDLVAAGDEEVDHSGLLLQLERINKPHTVGNVDNEDNV